MNDQILSEESRKYEQFEEIYNNMMQLQASVIDCNIMIIEAGRGSGKTTWFAKRFINVAYDLPGELSFFAHKTYIALLTNIIPGIISYFRTPVGNSGRSLLREGIDFVIGEKDLPDHFNFPKYPIENPKHSIVFANGHHCRLVASDQPDSIAGANGVHAFIEEMKHNKGEKIKSRMFPALRGGSIQSRKSPYYQGITGISDTARIDLGEDDWFEGYEKNVDQELISEIITVALHVNRCMFITERNARRIAETKDKSTINKLQSEINRQEKIKNKWMPTLRQMRRKATYYLRASSFVNKDFLGFDYFKTQMDVLTTDEFLAAIANIRPKKTVDMFFSGYNVKRNQYSDSYIYKSIYDFDLKKTFRLTAEYLKYFQCDQPLIMGYDPGHFSSIVIGQYHKKDNELRIIKEFFCWIPRQQGDMAKMIFEFFGQMHRNRRIILYYDRAGNKKKIEQDRITTDARLMKKELEAYKFNVEMKNEKQATIFYYEHFKLISMLLSENMRSVPRLLIDENECPMLCSSIMVSAVDRSEGKIALDKSGEKKLPYQKQAAFSTQLPSALMYMLYGLFSDKLPREISNIPELPSNLVVR